MSLNIVKQYTDNPFMDTLIYNVKKLAYTCILKNEAEALENETADSLTKSEMFLYASKNAADFNLYTSVFTEEMLLKVGIPAYYTKSCLKNPSIILTEFPMFEEDLIKLARQEILDKYVEQNNYYRKLMGLPPFGDAGIALGQYLDDLPTNIQDEIMAKYSYVHEMDHDCYAMMERYGVLDKIKSDYPNASYLDYGKYGIELRKTRLSADKQIIHLESCGIPEIDELFEEKFEIARKFTDTRVNSSAMEHESEHYHAFLCVYILFLTIMDCVSELQDRIVKKDVLDARCIEYIFEIYGIPYFKNIPLKYQIVLCKNVNSLVQYKSSPQEMFNLLVYFSAEDIQFRKFYLLRDRKMDNWGNYKYTQKEVTTSIYNTIIKHETEILTEDTSSNFQIHYPFEYYLAKGNVLFVFVDDVRMVEGVDYEIINYDQIRMITHNTGTHTIRIEYYYDESTRDGWGVPDTRYSLHIDHQLIETTNTPVYSFNLVPPTATYFSDTKEIFPSMSSVILKSDAAEINLSTNTFDIDSRFYNTTNRYIDLAYFSGNAVSPIYERKEVKATMNGQFEFNIPEPFESYCLYLNAFFIHIGSTYIEPSRYTIDPVAHKLTFIDGTRLLKNRTVTYNFIYSKSSIYEKLVFHHDTETIVATTYFQLEFKIHPPTNYLKKGYTPYVKLRGWYLDDSYFEAYGSTLSLTDGSIFLDPGDEIEVHYFYTSLHDNVKIKNVHIQAISNFQNVFDIEYPLANYFRLGNVIQVSSAGYPLIEGTDYTLSGPNKEILTLTNSNIYPYKGQRINIEFIYLIPTEHSVGITQKSIQAISDKQNTFIIDIPFDNYFESGHEFLLMLNSTVLERQLWDINSDNKLVLKDPVKNKIKVGDKIDYLFIYNNYYMSIRNQYLTVETATVPKTNMDKNGAIIVPEPFIDYVINDWPWFVDSNKEWIDPDTYDVINSAIFFFGNNQLKDYYTFTFIYKTTYPWIETKILEDNTKDIELKFLKIPLDAFMESSVHVKEKRRIKNYDSVTLADKKWDGDSNNIDAHSLHENLKKQILELDFNYARTKYMTVDYLVDISEMSFQISYFYNMLWDDVFLEDELKVEIPSILPFHKFKLAEIFCYMTSLMYLYRGVEDTIMSTPTSILSVKAFNYHADLNKLRDWMASILRYPSDYKEAFDFEIPTSPYPDIKSFIDNYKNNKKVHEAISYGMIHADNYDIYSIWKKLYDSLMVWEFNLKYFELSDGTVAPTFKAFLEEKDPVLFRSIEEIEAIEDKNARNDKIIETIQDITYILDEFIDTEEFRYVFDQFPGGSQELLLEYIFTMVNFFKSYKVVLAQYTVEYNFGGEDPENYIRPNDRQIMQVHLLKPDYISDRSKKISTMSTEYYDAHEIHEAYQFDYTYTP